MKKPYFIKLKVLGQGAPIVNNAFLDYGSPKSGCVAIGIDCKSKYCEVVAVGSDGSLPVIDIGANERTLHLNPKAKGELTEITFPEFEGWDVWSTTVGRYTIYACLIKRRK